MKYYDMERYNVQITDLAAEKMKAFIEIAPQEISGLGTVISENGVYLIDDIYLLKQACTPAYTELDQGKIIEFMTDQINEGNDDVVNRLRLWWHSHVNMGTFWSGTDRATIEAMQADEVWISIVGNKRGSRRVSVDYYNPRICFDCVPLQVIKTKADLSGVKEWCQKEIDEKVTFRTYLPVPRFLQEITTLNEVDEIMNNLEDEVEQSQSEEVQAGVSSNAGEVNE